MFRPNTMIANEAKRHPEIGLQEGFQQGIEQGIEKGKATGVHQSQKLVIDHMRKKGFSDQEIFEITGINVQQL
jgi:predicted transposase/invertase (TIGR01784 family)